MKVDITPKPYLALSLQFTNHTNSTAIADIIDNSIDAEAESIKVYALQENGQSIIRIVDDGRGMDTSLITKAITYGCHENDGQLGFFGMGLKSSSGHLGNLLTVLSKSEESEVVKAVLDFNQIINKNEWSAEVSNALTDEDVFLVNKHFNENTGTIVTISDLKYKGSMSQFADTIRKHLARVFRYYISPSQKTPTIRGKISLQLNEEELYAMDPLERHLPSTQIRFDGDIELGNGKTVHAIVSELDPNESGEGTSKDYSGQKGNFDFPANISNQGVYVVRNNREILAGDSSIFSQLWGQKHPSANYARVELRYCDCDSLFHVNHDKCGLKGIAQSVGDKIDVELRQYLTQIRKSELKRRVATDKETDDIHSRAGRSFSEKQNLLDLPRGKSHERKSTKTQEGTVNPKGSKLKRGGQLVHPISKVSKIDMGVCDYGTAGQLFDFSLIKGSLHVKWNINHAFYQKYVRGQSKEQVYAVDMLLFGLASKLCQIQQEDGDDGVSFSESFIESISKNLRSLSQ